MKLKDISSIHKIDPGLLSKLFSGKRALSYPMAVRFSKKFPEKDVEGWKNATPEEIKAALNKKVAPLDSQSQEETK